MAWSYVKWEAGGVVRGVRLSALMSAWILETGISVSSALSNLFKQRSCLAQIVVFVDCFN